jgi:hypothetical protein
MMPGMGGTPKINWWRIVALVIAIFAIWFWLSMPNIRT